MINGTSEKASPGKEAESKERVCFNQGAVQSSQSSEGSIGSFEPKHLNRLHNVVPVNKFDQQRFEHRVDVDSSWAPRKLRRDVKILTCAALIVIVRLSPRDMSVLTLSIARYSYDSSTSFFDEKLEDFIIPILYYTINSVSTLSTLSTLSIPSRTNDKQLQWVLFIIKTTTSISRKQF
jgi:hypothetical protein